MPPATIVKFYGNIDCMLRRGFLAIFFNLKYNLSRIPEDVMKARISLSLGLAALSALVLAMAQQDRAEAATYQNVAVPSCFYPPNYWPEINSDAPTVSLAICNPDSGPGSSSDSN